MRAPLGLLAIAILSSACARSSLPDGAGGGGEEDAYALIPSGAGGAASSARLPPETRAVACPLDADARAKLEAVVADALADAAWISKNSRGVLEGPKRRAFAVSVPFTPVVYRDTVFADDFGACDAPMSTAPSCAPSAGYSSCSYLLCRGPGLFAVNAWIDPIPVSFAAAAEKGISIEELEHTTSYAMNGGALVMGWATRYEVIRGRDVSVTISGGAHVEGDSVASMDLALWTDGLAADEIETIVGLDPDGPRGAATIDDEAVLAIDPSGLAWVGPCAGAR